MNWFWGNNYPYARGSWWPLAAVALMTGGSLAAAELATFETPFFSGAGNCAFCHDPWNVEPAGEPGQAALLASDWRATMMAHAFKDPLWRAVMEAEVEDHPRLKSVIENKCQTCHAPLARTQATADGTNELAFASALTSSLASEGVGCTLCHQIQPMNLGTHASFTGHYQIGTNRVIFGPYTNVFTMPMQRHVAYTPVHGAQVQDSALCATCHTLFTPILNETGDSTGEFPEQVPYLEWRNSDYARNGRHCQDCHMPRLDEAVKVSNRPPWLEPRAPFWKHQFVGGNAFMLGLFKANSEQLKPNAETLQFDRMIAQTRRQLERAATIAIKGRREDGTLVLLVDVENLSGHKFPTGHPYRRAWLHLRVNDAAGRILFESGGADTAGRMREFAGDYAPHYDVVTKPDQVQIYEAVMGDTAGRVTHSLLRAANYLKDNRLPPRGFRPDGSENAHTAILGAAAQDANFNAHGSGHDEVTYRVTVNSASGPLVAEVELLYQSVPPEAVAHLLQSRGPAAEEFMKLFSSADRQPERVCQSRVMIEELK